MRKRHIGVNEFARLCGVSNGTISKYQGKHPPTHTTTSFLKKLSQGTGTPLYSLLAIVEPQLEEETKIQGEELALLKRLMSEPQHTRDMFIRIIESMHDAGQQE